ncbi:homoserine dehydrogenase [Minwuia thermotolerans]|uniref:Homoserine dehydrogenase n=1 Tax=Minwuia thermotolerans TaxID=2056226 RepID=A0A2M9G0C2_9PROT|nr:homoserine dehydrogenase [Minwuia thermotolerans]PJK29171.1 homoserine dehydrogenase [Minwuia thermotolerans]
MTNDLRIAVAGVGTVGSGLIRLLEENADVIEGRAGRPLVVRAVSARNRGRDRGVDIDRFDWEDNPAALARRDDIDVVVELMGGSDGPARHLVETALQNGKPVVTANKALIAEHGAALARLADEKGLPFAYEAAVAGGIPIIKAVREGLSANRISRVYGILNGTCNYILTEMRNSGRDFDDVLKDAQELGYAEADPSFDVGGVDAAHKLAILASVCFGSEIDFAAVGIEGIQRISSVDIAYADEFGYRIKLLGVAEWIDGQVAQRVQPCLVRADTPIAKVEGVDNAIVTEANHVGRTMFEGPGAGAGPTASAVAADLVDIARRRNTPMFGLPSRRLTAASAYPPEKRRGHYYIRLNVLDRPGVIADVSAVLRDTEISIEQMLQRADHDDGGTAPVVVITHETTEARIMAALQRIEALDSIVETPHLLRIENF